MGETLGLHGGEMRDIEKLWTELARELLTIATSGDVDLASALRTTTALVERHAEVRCAISTAAHRRDDAAPARWSTETRLGRDDAARYRLHLEGEEPLDADAVARLARLFERLVAMVAPANAYAPVVHRVNNTLAALLANLDYVDSLIGEAGPSEPLPAETSHDERAELLVALGNARLSAQRLRDLLCPKP